MKYAIESTTLEEIAEAIREKTGGSDAIEVVEMAAKINTIEVSGGGSESWDEGYNVGYSEGYDGGYVDGLNDGLDDGWNNGYENALAERTDLVVTENGEYTPPEGSTGFKSVSVNVTARNILPQVLNKTVTEIVEEDLQGAETISTHLLEGCTSLRSIAIPDTVKTIGVYSVSGCTALSSIVFGANSQCMSIGDYAFSECAITSITLPNTLTRLAPFAFTKCASLAAITIPPKVATVDQGAFQKCTSLASVVFAENSKTKTIGVNAFSNCGSLLTTITIPASVTSINNYAFNGTYLKHIVMKSTTPPTIFTNTFPGGVTSVTVPAGCGEAYKSATNWSALASKIVEDPDADTGDSTGNWLFENEYIDFNRTDLPAPEVGVSYTCFVDGEEIGTATAGSWGDGAGEVYTEIEFMTEECRVWLKYDSSTEYVWFFHPIDSAVQSGSVSIRING
jgi:hypothetical protein